MASSASTSTAASSTLEVRPQADALPMKRGEIGFRESFHHQEQEMDVVEQAQAAAMPLRHPADTPTPPASETRAPQAEAAQPSRSTPASDNTSARKIGKSKLVAFFFKSGEVPRIGGIYLTSLLRFLFQLIFIGGTLAGWVIIIRHLQTATVPADTTTDSDGVPQLPGSTGSIFIHVAFGVATLAQLLFLERSVFRLRAERYCFLHPGEMMPGSRHYRSPSSATMGFAPWNRPPLPSYAATLAQSGYGTGDVEDNAIAIPPPPAYGNTRGSTLLLAGFLRNSLRRGSAVEDLEAQRQETRAREPQGRPLSYISTNEEHEQRCDAERALRLEETLARLEEGAPVSSSQAQRR